MSRILILLPIVLWFLWADVAEPAQPAPADAASVQPVTLVLFFAALILIVMAAAFAALRSAQREQRRQEGRAPALLPLVHRLALPAVLAWFGIGLFVMGWGELVSSATALTGLPGLRTPGLMLATLPVYGAWALLLAAEYPAVRLRRESRLLVDIDQGRPIYPPPPPARYWLQALRQRLLFAVVPLLMLMAARDAAILGFWGLGINLSPQLELWLFVLGALLVIAISPELVRRLLPTHPLAKGPLRERLEALCEKTGLPMRNILVWNTDGAMVNAAVVGFLPRLRYVLLSDVLLDSMTPVQVEAVFAHEIGHVKHRHLLWYFVFLAGMTLFFAGPVESAWRGLIARYPTLESAVAAEYVIGLGSLAVILGLFGLLSRCFERQADVFAARTMQAQASAVALVPLSGAPAVGFPGPVGSVGAEVFGSSLKQAARMNDLPLDHRPAQPGPLAPLWWLADQLTHFLHGTVRSRIEYLENLARRPSQTYRFDLSITAVKLAVLAMTIGSGSFLFWS